MASVSPSGPRDRGVTGVDGAPSGRPARITAIRVRSRRLRRWSSARRLGVSTQWWSSTTTTSPPSAAAARRRSRAPTRVARGDASSAEPSSRPSVVRMAARRGAARASSRPSSTRGPTSCSNTPQASSDSPSRPATCTTRTDGSRCSTTCWSSVVFPRPGSPTTHRLPPSPAWARATSERRSCSTRSRPTDTRLSTTVAPPLSHAWARAASVPPRGAGLEPMPAGAGAHRPLA